tara:strand:- start:10736 stop:11095 length:360 start_codon:yes stop_codon:yes gene_type:complete
MDKEQLEALIGEYGWMAVLAFFFLIGRNTIETAIEAIKVFAGGDLNTDDVIIFDDRPARVVRVGLWKTILFVYEVGSIDGKPFVKGGNKVAIQNDKLKDHMIEKPLPMLDLKKWENVDK